MSIEHIYPEIRRFNIEYLIVLEMIRDVKRMLNPLLPLPEKIALAKFWSKYVCRAYSKCIEISDNTVDIDSQIEKLAEYVVEYITSVYVKKAFEVASIE